MDTKTCTKCGQVKPVDEYHASPTTRDRLRPECKTCNRAAARAWYTDNRARAITAKKVYGVSPGGKATHRRYVTKVQKEANDRARNHRKEWTGPELELVADSSRSTRDLAKALGRTFYSVQYMRRRVRIDPRKARMAGTEN